jgi:DNA-binding MarR family transcriptional regulator
VTGPDPQEVWRELRALVVEGLDAHRRQIAEVTGLPFSRIRAVRRLKPGPLTHAELADAMLVDRPAASVAVDDLSVRGLVVRRAHPSDRRCKLVALTDEGYRMAELIESIIPPAPPGWDELGTGQLEALAELLGRCGGRGITAARRDQMTPR